jgi:hypothetical protein
VTHLEAIGCHPESVAEYIRLEQRTLASLYHLVREPAPSPTKLQRLVYRAALDARRPIQGDINRFTCQHGSQGWVITEYPSAGHTVVPLPPPGGVRPVWNPIVGAILRCVLADPPRIANLMGIIERALGGVPGQSDTLEGSPAPTFTFAVTEGAIKGPRVRLWIGDREVALPGVADVHKLLRELCLHPDARWKGRQLQRERHLTNASQAARQIKEALQSTYPEAGGWLLTEPFLSWADDHRPSPQADRQA